MSHRSARAGRAALALAAAGAGCGEPPAPRTVTAAARESVAAPTAREGYAVQLSSYSDPARAARLARALTDSGWAPTVQPVAVGAGRQWRVYVGATAGGSALADLLAAGVRVAGGEALVARDSFAPAQLADSAWVRAVSPNAGSVGMLARARWALSPDSSALIVVEDPEGVAGAPVVNGFVYASEALDCYFRADSVWDVAPSPAWDRVAYSRGYGVMGAAESPTGAGAWQALADSLRLPADSVRRGSFAVGGLASGRSVAQPVVLAPAAAGAGGGLTRRTLGMAGGWRLRWSADGERLAAGANPTRATDDAPPRRWLAALPAAAPRALAPGTVAELARTRWMDGPTLDPSLPVELTRGGSAADGTRLRNRGGWIRLATPSGQWRIVGPGVALAATKNGRFVVALAPHQDAFRDAPTAQIVLYATSAAGRGAAGVCPVTDSAG